MLSVTDSADPVPLGGAAPTYTVAVANLGPGCATGVPVSTTLSGSLGTDTCTTIGC
ncbi:hypothetical protein AB0I60_21910 [Actinosynnema sp. NPDC050436]|uniref:hypothetical protein n=1 Tax=Actinosynnema sp. NPDC050436 TaxID=3155659 RepID=UPI0033C2C172